MGTRRKAIAATISSLVIFGTLVASNVALYESQEQGVVLHTVSDEAKAVATEAELAKGLVALSLLRTSQSVLEAGSHPCSDPLGAMPALRSIALSSSLGGIAANARGAVTWSGIQSDNLTLLAPFTGFVTGYLNFAFTVNLKFSTSLVQYHKAEVHYLHLPVLYDESIATCLSAVGYLHSKVQGLKRTPGACATPSILGAIAEADLRYRALAREAGLTLSISSSSMDRGGVHCPTMSYEVVVSQYGVPGVSGDFTWRVSEGGSLLA